MDARVAVRGRRTGSVALLAALLCAFGMLAPAVAQAHADTPLAAHLVKVVSLSSVDQFQPTLRVDQPLVAATRLIEHVTTAPDETTRTTTATTNSPATDTARTRGPPTDAGSQ